MYTNYLRIIAIQNKKRGVSKSTIEADLLEAEASRNSLYQLINEYDDISASITDEKQHLDDLSIKIQQLNAQRRHLSLFAAKERRSLDNTIRQYEEEMNQRKGMIENAQKRLNGFNSKTQLTDVYKKTDNKISDLQSSLEAYNNPTSGYVTFEDALQRIKENNGLRARVFEKYADEAISIAEEGDIIRFGRYQQQPNTIEKEPIQWIVINKQENELLLISLKGLDCVQYDTKENRNHTWVKCSLRKWLNTEFFNEVFSLQEQKKIQTSLVIVYEKNTHQFFPDALGQDTKDRVFLLSCDEYKKYYDTISPHPCCATEYAKAKMIREEGEFHGIYRFRGTGDDVYCTPVYREESGIDKIGLAVYFHELVRPVIRIIV